MKMSKRAAKALEKSIAHWERNLAADRISKVALGSGACALCKLYIDAGCVSCPVFKQTGEAGCRRTPYSKAAMRYSFWRAAYETVARKRCREMFRETAQEMVDLLKGLRDE